MLLMRSPSGCYDVAAAGVDTQILSKGATVACSGHVVGPIRSTRWSFGAFIGVGGRGCASGFGGGFLLPRGRSSVTERRRSDRCSLGTPTGLHNGVYNYGKNKRTLMNTPGPAEPASDEVLDLILWTEILVQ